MKTLEEKIAVMQAHAAGKPVQCKYYTHTLNWVSVVNPNWNWAKYDYQIAPEKLTIYIYNNPTCGTQPALFASVGPLNVSYITLIKTIEVEV